MLLAYDELIDMAKAAARTSLMPMVLVAVEQTFPREQRIVDDSLAYRMLPFGGRMFACLLRVHWLRDWLIATSEKSNPGIWGGLLCRKRYIDEKLLEASSRLDAIVNLGAGFDTRIYRLTAVSQLPAWEVDQPMNIGSKKARLEEIFEKIPPNVHLVPIDFDHQDLGAALAAHGYSIAGRTFFIWEAVSQYLTEPGARKTFEFLSRAAVGSRLVFTYVRRDFLDGTALYGWESGYKRFVASKVWLFGMEPEAVPNFLEEYGWSLVEDVGYDELAPRYIGASGRKLKSTPVERMVFAEKLTS